MKKRKWKRLWILIGVLCLAGCGRSDSLNHDEEQREIEETSSNSYYRISSYDLMTEEEGEEIHLFDADSKLKIEEGGAYCLSGNMEGQIFIDTIDENVHLIFENVAVESNHGPALYVKSAGKVVITLAKDTSNLLSDSPDYENYKEQKACVYSNSDVTINGSGRLDVYGYYKDAIKTKGEMKILGGMINVESKKRGIRANDGIVIAQGKLNLQCEGDGISTQKHTDDVKGYIEICGGDVSVISGKCGIHARGDLRIYNCKVRSKGIIEDYSCEGYAGIYEECIVDGE